MSASIAPETETADENDRLAALRRVVARLYEHKGDAPPPEAVFDAIAVSLADALIGQDQQTLAVAGDIVRPLQAGWVALADDDARWAAALGRLQGVLAVAFAGAERLVAPAVTTKIAASSRARRVLGALADGRTRPTESLRERTGLDSSAISHTAKPLVADGLVTREQVGKGAYWTITPQGRAALEAAGGPPKLDSVQAGPGDTADERAPILAATTWEPLTLDEDALRAATTHANSAPARSRLWCLELLANHSVELRTRLLSWDSLGRFAADDRIEFAVAPLGMGKPGRLWERALTNVVRHADADFDLAEFWPASPPAFDAYAVVRGKDGQNGVVLVEAKSDAHEFRLGKPRVKRDDHRRQIGAAVRLTGHRIGAEREWHTWSAFPDPVGRLAMLSHLRELGIEAWLFNLYFVPTDTTAGIIATPRVTDWWNAIDQVRDELAIASGHKLSDYVKHEFIEVPEAAALDTVR